MKNIGARLVETAGVSAARERDVDFSAFVVESLIKFTENNWGQTAEDSVERNNAIVTEGVKDQLFAVYKTDLVEGEKAVWIITEWDKSVTTILFPSEY